MEVRIKYKDIIDRCEQLSSFEARGKVDANGESRYLDIHINEVDKQLVMQYILQARTTLEGSMERMISAVVEIKDQAFVWKIRSDARWKPSSTFQRHITETIASYTMAQWLSGRLDERVAFYEGLFANSLALATKNIFTKQAPTYEI